MQNTNVTTNLTKHDQKLKYKRIIQNIFKTVRKALIELQILKNTIKTVRRKQTYQTLQHNTLKTLRKKLT